MRPDSELHPFAHEKNITVGNGRIMYGSKCFPVSGGPQQKEGWVLPGGTRTQDRDRAFEVAQWINDGGVMA